MTKGDAVDRKSVPDDFYAATKHSGFGRHIGPYYFADIEDAAGDLRHWTGLKVDDRHAGRAGGEYGHGGILMVLLDEVMGRTASRTVGKVCMTVSMQTNFCAPFYNGDFLRASATVSRRGRNLVFVDAVVKCADETIGTASGVWMNSGQSLP